MDASTVTSKGQVTIPQDIRRALGIRQGSRVAFVAKNGKAELRVLHRAPEAVVSGFGARGRHVPADFDAASLLAPVRTVRTKSTKSTKTTKGSGRR